jgi:hypothetical protein
MKLIAAAILTALLPSAATAFTEQQTKDIASLRGANAAAALCKEYIVDDVASYVFLSKSGLDPNDTQVMTALTDERKFLLAIAYLASTGPDKACPFTWELYGPGSSRFSGLLKRTQTKQGGPLLALDSPQVRRKLALAPGLPFGKFRRRFDPLCHPVVIASHILTPSDRE